MSQLPYTLYRAADTRELDRIAIQQFGIPGIELMNRAGAVVFDELCGRWPEARTVVIVCGAGNNAGDGYVVARLAKERGMCVSILALTDPAELKGDAGTAWNDAQLAGLSVNTFDAEFLSRADVVVDAIFGIGLDRPVEGECADAIATINASGVPVLAIDIPSGLHADSGCVLGQAIRAEATVSFIGLKQGLLTADGIDYCGAVSFDDLGVNLEIYKRVDVACERIDWLRLSDELPARPNSAHKGLLGHTLIIGGNHGMAGAAYLAAEAAARVGSGLTSVATRPAHVAAMSAARPEVMWQAVASGAALRAAMQRATVIAVGPGLGQDEWARELFDAALQSDLPLIVDADALNLLSQESFQRSNWILTPHPGEAARLLECSNADINRQRFKSVNSLAEKYQAVAVLKGAGTLVCDEQGAMALCSDGNPGMATGGMGDVLTGIIAGLVAQKIELSAAARMGVALHAAAADKVALTGARGMMAGDVINELRVLVN